MKFYDIFCLVPFLLSPFRLGGLLYLRLGLHYLRLRVVAYGNLACSSYLGLKFGLVLFAYGAKSA